MKSMNEINKIAVNVLGTRYTIAFKSEKEEERLEENWGFCDFYAKEIYIRDDIEEEAKDNCRNLEEFKKKVIRHEIIHAFLYESGLRENTHRTDAWAEDEEMVDWIAIQMPKLTKIFNELGIM